MAQVMIARVELTTSLSHERHGRVFYRGKPQMLTNPDEIQYYQSQSGFSVTIMNPQKSKVAVVEESVVTENIETPDEDDIDTDEDEDDEDDIDADEDEDEDEDEDDIDTDEDEDDIDEKDNRPTFTKAQLLKLKKSELAEIAKELGINSKGTTDELRAKISKATKK